jgi:phosphoribosylamine---glycine ligase
MKQHRGLVSMKILVIGGGGREHALVWRLAQSPQVNKIWCAPGNGGVAAQAECVAIDSGDVRAITEFADTVRPDLTVVGPELPLVNGIADAFAKRGWPIVAPSKQASRLEGSKIFTKLFLERHGIPTAKMYGAFDSASAARAALACVHWPLVLKADGLCAGKGVFLASDEPSATDFIDRVMERQELGAGGKRMLLEQTLEGEELSFIIVTDGARYAPLVPTRDHKRAFDGNEGPNTGGMGAYSSDELLPANLRESILRTVVEPTLKGLASDGIGYQGFLYFGLMLTKSGPQVLEFNCRLGDPEAQAIVVRMDFDLAEVLATVASGRLDPSRLMWTAGASVCLVLASGGYPGPFATGKPITGLTAINENTGLKVFHAGTRPAGDSVVTSGGRVLGVTATGLSLEHAVGLAYGAASQIRFEGMHYRRDIAAPAGRVRAAGD